MGPPSHHPVTPQATAPIADPWHQSVAPMAPTADPWRQPVAPPPMGPNTAGGWPPAPPPGSGRTWWQDPSRRPLVWTAGAGAALVVIVAIILGFTVVGRGGAAGQIGGKGSAGDLVKSYLEALARGDAQAALSASDNEPGSTDFLTDDVLKQQIAKWPITNIRILGDDSGPGSMTDSIGYAQVHASANFGDKVSDVNWVVKKKDGRWRLDGAAVKYSPELPGLNFAANKTLTLFGKPFTSVAYVFPGWVDLGSSNPYLDFGAQEILLDKLLAGYTTGAYVQPTVTVNAAGTKAVADAVAAAFTTCQSSKQLAPPPPCPLAVSNTDGSLVDGTATWAPADVSAIKQEYFNAQTLQLSVLGDVRVQVSAQERGGGTTSGEIKHFVSGRADLSVSPPKVTFS
jgi:hypothetical protein